MTPTEKHLLVTRANQPVLSAILMIGKRNLNKNSETVFPFTFLSFQSYAHTKKKFDLVKVATNKKPTQLHLSYSGKTSKWLLTNVIEFPHGHF